MQIQPNRDQFIALCAQGNLVPVYADLMADLETPVSAYAKLKKAGPSFLLESVEGGEHLSRYSFIGVRPRKIFACGPEFTTIRSPESEEQTVPTPADPLKLIEAEMAGITPVVVPDLPRFTGGAVGFVGYEYVTRVETTVPVAPIDEHQLPLIYFMLVDSAAIFDRAKQTLRLCVNAHIGDDPDAAYDSAVAEINELADLLKLPSQLTPASSQISILSTCPRATSPSPILKNWSNHVRSISAVETSFRSFPPNDSLNHSITLLSISTAPCAR